MTRHGWTWGDDETHIAAPKLLIWLLLGVVSWLLLLGLVWLCARVAGGPRAWMIGLPLAAVGWVAAARA